MKKIGSLIFLICILLIMVSCGKKNNSENESNLKMEETLETTTQEKETNSETENETENDIEEYDETTENIVEVKYNLGDIVSFGSYEQDANLNDGQEPIEWYVVKIDGDKALLLSKNNIVCQPYDENKDGSDYKILWSKSSIREYLNDNFFNDAFSEKQQSMILDTQVSGAYDDKILNDITTTDKIFILSATELLSLNGAEKNITNSNYILSMKENLLNGEVNLTASRNIDNNGLIIAMRDDMSLVYCDTFSSNTFYAFRPAMYVTLEALDYNTFEKSVSGEKSQNGNFGGMSYEQATRSASKEAQNFYINQGEKYYPIPKKIGEISGNIVKCTTKDFIIPKVHRGDMLYAFSSPYKNGNSINNIYKIGRMGYASLYALKVSYNFDNFKYLSDGDYVALNNNIEYTEIDGIAINQFNNYVEDDGVSVIGTFWELFYNEPTTVNFKYYKDYQEQNMAVEVNLPIYTDLEQIEYNSTKEDAGYEIIDSSSFEPGLYCNEFEGEVYIFEVIE